MFYLCFSSRAESLVMAVSMSTLIEYSDQLIDSCVPSIVFTKF